MNAKDLKLDKTEKLKLLEIKFQYWMGIVEVFSPLFIQSIPAALTFVSIGTIFPNLLHIEAWLAWSIAAFVSLGIETLGLVTVDVFFASKTFNQTKKENEGKAPEGAALLVMLIYAVTALLIVVLLKMFPTLAIWSLIPLTLMSILIVSAVTMKKRLSELVSVREDEKNEQINEQVNSEQKMYIEQLNKRIEQLVNEHSEQKVYIEQLNNKFEQLNSEQKVYIEQLNNKFEQLNSEQKVYIEQFRNGFEHMNNVQKVTNEHMNSDQTTIATPTKSVQPIVQRDNNKLTKDEKMNMLIAHLIEHYDGVNTEQLNKSQLAIELPIDRVTIGRYLNTLKDEKKLNGHVNKDTLLQ